MYTIVRKISGFHALCIVFVLYEQILADNYYTINERYPIAVRRYSVPHSRSGLKRDAKYYDFPPITSKHNQSIEFDESKKRSRLSKAGKHRRPCIRCPRQINAIARKGLDGILVELPAPLSCKTNLPFAHNLYQIETLFSPDLPFILPHGKHTFIAKIRNVESGLVIRSCQLKYNVIVRRCDGFPQLKRKNVKMSCTAQNIWGSECAFECKNDEMTQMTLSHHEAIVCNDDLKWIGEEPECVADSMDNALPYVQDEYFCAHPTAPENGQYICEMKNDEFHELIPKLKVNTIETYKTLAPGSKCHILCDRSYSIPYHLRKFSEIVCTNGAWNSTDIEFCYKKHRRQNKTKRPRRGRTQRQSKSMRQHT